MARAVHAFVVIVSALHVLTGCAAQDSPGVEDIDVVTPSVIDMAVLEPHLREGDVLFRGRDGGWGNLGALVSRHDQRYGHVGMVVATPEGWFVIHAAGDPATPDGRVRRDALSVFLSKSMRAGLYRTKFSDADLTAFTLRLSEHEASGLAFDRDYDLASEDRQYCSEMIWRAMMDISGQDPVPDKTVFRGRAVIALDDLQRAELLDEVIHVDSRSDHSVNEAALMTHPQ